MLSKITYLFGAGASADAVPIVSEMPKAMEKAINVLSKEMAKEIEFDSTSTDVSKPPNIITKKSLWGDQLTLLIADLTWLYEKSKDHASVDTFAKKLYLQKKFGEL